MHILSALREIAEHHDAHVKMMTPWGKKQDLVNLLIDEAIEHGKGRIDPNNSLVMPDGIHYDNGGMAYRIE